MNEPLFHWPAPASAGGRRPSRLGLAALLGALMGRQRERVHSTAGLRTHMLVSVGSAFFVLAAIEAGATAGRASAASSRGSSPASDSSARARS